MIKNLQAFFKLIRWQNLLILWIAQLLFIFKAIPSSLLPGICIGITLLIAASGYVLNDILDRKIDAINRPNDHVIGTRLSVKQAWWIYGILTVYALLFSIYAYWTLTDSSVIIFTIAEMLLVALYSFLLKRTPLLGNLLVAILTGSVFIFPIWFINFDYDILYPTLFFVFAMLTTLAREVVKDMEDIEGDKAEGCKTFPILCGITTSKTFVITVLVACIAGLALLHRWFLYLPIGSIAVGIFFLIKANKKHDYHTVSNILKITMLIGIATLFFV